MYDEKIFPSIRSQFSKITYPNNVARKNMSINTEKKNISS